MKSKTKKAEGKTAVLRGRVPETLKTRVLSLASKKLTTEGQIVREAVSNWLAKHEAA